MRSARMLVRSRLPLSGASSPMERPVGADVRRSFCGVCGDDDLTFRCSPESRQACPSRALVFLPNSQWLFYARFQAPERPDLPARCAFSSSPFLHICRGLSWRPHSPRSSNWACTSPSARAGEPKGVSFAGDGGGRHPLVVPRWRCLPCRALSSDVAARRPSSPFCLRPASGLHQCGRGGWNYRCRRRGGRRRGGSVAAAALLKVELPLAGLIIIA